MPVPGSHSRKAHSKEADLPSARILAACREGECPLCLRQAEAACKWLEALLHEQVNDPETRRRLRHSHGFCPGHSWLLATLPQANLGVALIYGDLLDDAVTALEAAIRVQASRRRRSADALLTLIGRARVQAACPVCRAGDALVTSAAGVILTSFTDPDFQRAFGRSAGLCLSHLTRVAEVGAGHPNLPALLTWHVGRWHELEADLGEFVRKFDYRHAGEPMGRERDSWLRVLRLFAGRGGGGRHEAAEEGPDDHDEPGSANEPRAGG